MAYIPSAGKLFRLAGTIVPFVVAAFAIESDIRLYVPAAPDVGGARVVLFFDRAAAPSGGSRRSFKVRRSRDVSSRCATVCFLLHFGFVRNAGGFRVARKPEVGLQLVVVRTSGEING